MTDRETAEFILDLLEKAKTGCFLDGDFQFRSKITQVKEMVRLNKEKEEFLKAVDSLVEISEYLKDTVNIASSIQINDILNKIDELRRISDSLKCKK